MESKKIIHFNHANGFPPGAYKSLLSNLGSNLIINNFLLSTLNEKNKSHEIKNWIPFHNEFIQSLKNDKVIGMGHSIGGNIILRSALSHPKYFSKLVLLDPTLFIPKIILMWKIVAFLNLQKKVHPWIHSTLNRKMNYKNFNEIFVSYRKKKVFSKINDYNLSVYIKSITKELKDKTLQITYSKQWEYQIYKTGLIADNYIWKNINKLKIETLIIKAEHSNAFINSSAKKIKKLNSNYINIIEIKNATHLFPMEYPDKATNIILDFIT